MLNSYRLALALLATSLPPVSMAQTDITVPYFPSAGDPDRQGFVRVINHSGEEARFHIHPTDDAGTEHASTAFIILPGETMHFNSEDFEFGNPDKRIPMGPIDGEGDWRLRIVSEKALEVLGYIRTPDGLVAPMFDVVPPVGRAFRVPVFNPASNVEQISQLRLINAWPEVTDFHIVATDDIGEQREMTVSLSAGIAVTIDARTLEEQDLTYATTYGDLNVSGRLGDGKGKWQLKIHASNPEAIVMNLMSTPTGHVTNLSDSPSPRWLGLVVEAEDRCTHHDYDRGEYGKRYSNREDDIVGELGAIYSPYTNECFGSTDETEIEHIVAINEAHTSGLCDADTETKRRFAGDLLNLTLASSETNREKHNLDALDWSPTYNQCWFAERVRAVKLKYGMTVDVGEASALESILRDCQDVDLDPPPCADE